MVLHALLVLPRKIVVAVDQRHFAQDAIDACSDAAGLSVCGGGDNEERDGEPIHAAIICEVARRFNYLERRANSSRSEAEVVDSVVAVGDVVAPRARSDILDERVVTA